MSSIKGQYLKGRNGQRKGFLVSMAEYKKLCKILEDIRDAKYIHRHSTEMLIPMDVVHDSIKK